MNRVRRTACIACGALASLALSSVALGGAAPQANASAAPEFSGFFVRVGNLWFDPLLDDNEGKPIVRQDLDGPDAENIWAGDFNNPILQPWARDIVKSNAESEMRLEHVYTADDS